MKTNKSAVIVVVGCLIAISILLLNRIPEGKVIKDPEPPALKPEHSIKPIAKKSGDYPIQIIPTDTVDGRPTYTVIFSDNTAMDSMYGEEIGASLVSGKWGYDEDYKISR